MSRPVASLTRSTVDSEAESPAILRSAKEPASAKLSRAPARETTSAAPGVRAWGPRCSASSQGIMPRPQWRQW